MAGNDVIFNRIAEALLIDYASVCYVNAGTGEYEWYSLDPDFRSLQIERGGRDFFSDIAQIARSVVHPDDQHIFTNDMRKDRLLSAVKEGRMQSVAFRMLIGGKPVYHRLRLIRKASDNEDYFVLGAINIEKEMRIKQSAERFEREREQFNQIAHSLASHYDTIYYVNMETNHYIEFSSTDIYKQMRVPPEGNDFFAESRKTVEKFVHPEDRAKVEALHNKETLLKNLEARKTHAVTYRLVIFGEVMHCRHFEMWAGDRKHVIICVENINEEVAREETLRQTMAINVTYSQIAERLADRYDTIYYVDAETEQYAEFSSTNLLQALAAPAGSSFFAVAKKNIANVIHPDDQTMLYAFLNKSLLLGTLHFPEVRQLEYRLVINGVSVYVRLSAMFTKDQRHLLFCVENIDKQVRALKSANKMARTDELTGTKNKLAYQELEESFQANINSGTPFGFAVIVCDLNNLKAINDSQGHQAGDRCIKAIAKLLCDTFTHSPVFRIGGDEFAVVLSGSDYDWRDALLDSLRAQILGNLKRNVQPVAATGISVFDPASDKKFSDVFARADSMMYDYKRDMKRRL